jgi:hypothetical protein
MCLSLKDACAAHRIEVSLGLLHSNAREVFEAATEDAMRLGLTVKAA